MYKNKILNAPSKLSVAIAGIAAVMAISGCNSASPAPAPAPAPTPTPSQTYAYC